MVARQNEMARINAFPNARGTRSIVATLSEALVGFRPTRTNRTPCPTTRVNALINYLQKQSTGSEVDAHPLVITLHRLQFRSMTRDEKKRCNNNGLERPYSSRKGVLFSST